jgi:hypothetical protein
MNAGWMLLGMVCERASVNQVVTGGGEVIIGRTISDVQDVFRAIAAAD